MTGADYEIDKLREPVKKESPVGDYELTQCAAYGPVNRDTD